MAVLFWKPLYADTLVGMAPESLIHGYWVEIHCGKSEKTKIWLKNLEDEYNFLCMFYLIILLRTMNLKIVGKKHQFLCSLFGLVSCGCRIHQLHLCQGVRPPPNKCPGYDIKQSDGEVSVMLEVWGRQSTRPLPLLPCPLWPRVVTPDRVLSMG